MGDGQLDRRLTPMDAFFLYVERPEAPMHVGCVSLFEGKLPFRKFVKHLEERIHLIPRYQQRVVPPPFSIGHPTWEFDPGFHIENHITQTTLPKPGSAEELRAYAARMYEVPLDRDKPLWEIHVVYGLEKGRSAIVTKVHHCMIDGIAGVELMTLVLDTVPNPCKVKKQYYAPPPLPDKGQQIYDALWDNAIGALEHWTRLQRDLAEYSGDLGPKEISSAFKEFSTTMAGFLSPIRRLPFNKPFSGKRTIAWCSISFAEAREIRKACGGTFNDIMLSVLAGAIRSYLLEMGHSTRHETLRVLVPVNLRRENERGKLGNRITFLPVEVPLRIHNPVERLEVVSETMTTLKQKRVAEAINLMFEILQSAYAPIQATVVAGAASPLGRSMLGLFSKVPPLHLICTNVPGPQVPLYGVGRRLIENYVFVPITLEMGITCGITTYDQRVFASIIGDEATLPDAEALTRHFQAAFEELRLRSEVEQEVYSSLHSANGNGAAKPISKPVPSRLPRKPRQRAKT
ncbi:MAG: diacylglycerol O-acyltransferase [Candidatus Hydrogenedentota bacterium]